MGLYTYYTHKYIIQNNIEQIKDKKNVFFLKN